MVNKGRAKGTGIGKGSEADKRCEWGGVKRKCNGEHVEDACEGEESW